MPLQILRRACIPWMCLLLLGASTSALAADTKPAPPASGEAKSGKPLDSGPKTGSTVHSFFVRAVTGPHRNRSVCYVCRYGARPVVMVFIQKVDPKLPELLKAIDKIVDANRVTGLRSFGVLVTDESSRAVPVLQTMAFDERIRMPLTAATTAVAGPGGNRLHREAATTVVLYREQKAVTNLAFRHGKLDEAATKQVLGGIKELLNPDDDDRREARR